jgi:hypothetical protein
MSTNNSVIDLSGVQVIRVWTREQEDLLAQWGDVAACYNWMHVRAEKLSANKNLMITVPAIVLSTLSGSANFILSATTNTPGAQTYGSIIIGCVSIFTGVLTTLGNFFRYAQNSEANRGAAISWGKLQRNISVELALHPKERTDPKNFIKGCRLEMDRLIEQSPQLPDSVIDAFELEFQDKPNLKKPDIAHGIEHTKIYIKIDKDSDTAPVKS